MSLRRLAQENNATASATSSPRSNGTSESNGLPSTPRNKAYIYRSPASTPSISSSIPFDWEAARARRPPPYGTPLQNKARKSLSANGNGVASSRKGVVRKKSLIQKITSIPSWIAFQIAVFPNNLPLPTATTSAWIVGGLMHFLNLCVRVSQLRQVPDADLGWEDLYREREDEPWFDWTTPTSLLILIAACLNAGYLFTRIKLYRLHYKTDPVASPNASFVSEQLDFEPLRPPSVMTRVRSGLGNGFSRSWRWLLNMSNPSSTIPPGRTSRIQQLQVWAPGDFEMALFAIYSPAHALLWMATNTTNSVVMLLVMGLVGAQLNALTHSYKLLLKDKDIIAAEVLNEYNQVFVYPRVHPIRHDVAVMTHEAEVVNVWDD
ncbi:hypothetical protein BDN72DRAFT_808966 [Pluteus cervinus]|uniref:Uncharacterized protein n=1 Tax=Pluteus cervinus TaxID=181527 RepID=A0ACD3BHD1_9AGAR|nr:hypothetical protein BDN72DRAFT_808966 [Pluteus cervinus]